MLDEGRAVLSIPAATAKDKLDMTYRDYVSFCPCGNRRSRFRLLPRAGISTFVNHSTIRWLVERRSTS